MGSYLEDVLLAIDDGKASNLVNSSNITGVQPTLRVDGIAGVFLILVVAVNDMASTETDLTSGVGQIGRAVVHVRHIDQLDLASRARSANNSCLCFPIVRDGKQLKKMNEQCFGISKRYRL